MTVRGTGLYYYYSEDVYTKLWNIVTKTLRTRVMQESFQN
jgi:hypothetical protein